MTNTEPELQQFTYRLVLRCMGTPPQIVDIYVDGNWANKLRHILLAPEGMVEIVSRAGSHFIFDTEAVVFAYDLGNSWTTTPGTVEIR